MIRGQTGQPGHDGKETVFQCPPGKFARAPAAGKIFTTEFAENHGGARRKENPRAVCPVPGFMGKSPCASVVLRELRAGIFWRHQPA